MAQITWDSRAREAFDKIIAALPQFHRSIAEKLVKESAEEIAAARGGATVEEQDLVKAFFKEVPPAFKDMMKRLLGQLKIDYGKYLNGQEI